MDKLKRKIAIEIILNNAKAREFSDLKLSDKLLNSIEEFAGENEVTAFEIISQAWDDHVFGRTINLYALCTFYKNGWITRKELLNG